MEPLTREIIQKRVEECSEALGRNLALALSIEESKKGQTRLHLRNAVDDARELNTWERLLASLPDLPLVVAAGDMMSETF